MFKDTKSAPYAHDRVIYYIKIIKFIAHVL